MKFLLTLLVSCACTVKVFPQSQEVQQLLLNWEKLSQLKAVLNNMYQGYKVVSAGYNKVKDISAGTFKLHEAFLDGLLKVNPAVKNYRRVAEIISHQQKMLAEQKSALSYFKKSGGFLPQELAHLVKVYQNLLAGSLKSLDELSLVLTAGKLRMSDDERLEAIDQIFWEMEDRLAFLRSLNNSTKLLALQRKHEAAEIDHAKRIHAIE